MRCGPLRERGRLPGTAGILPASTHRWACGGSSHCFNRPPAGCGRDARAPRERPRIGAFLGARASCPLQHTGGPAAHLRAGRPRSQETTTHRRLPGTAGILPASTHRWACGPLAGGTPAIPGNDHASAPSWDRGHLARFNTPVGLRPTCGRDARDPRERPRIGAFLGTRASCPLQHTGGPAAHLRAGRPRSQGKPFCTDAFLGTRASCPLQHTGGPAAHLRAGRPRSQGTTTHRRLPGTAGILPASTHRWACGPLAGGTPALPGNDHASAPSRERGQLARFNTPVGLRPTAGGTPAIPGPACRTPPE